MPSRGKAKGNAWERELAALLSKQFNLPFQRVPNSGAFLGGFNAFRRNTLDAKQSRIMTGDLIVPEELNHVSFECKFYKTFDYHLLYKQNKQFEGWIDQTIEGSNIGQIWFLCIKANRKEPIIAFQNGYFLEYLSENNFSSYIYNGKAIFITDLKRFIEKNKEYILHLGKSS
jgi:Holliday junction resolvase